ncbi:uncharacterized protein LOC134178654 [Corticium candelabrum]|uniref:uncharacterized protein LOC134178654 n=1 Tax=Corticium candelabrum TaxID=121492 RepID=UPI002E270E89|nr:uncharacterized protein LOC134178654 [Corticium candelabrum]
MEDCSAISKQRTELVQWTLSGCALISLSYLLVRTPRYLNTGLSCENKKDDIEEKKQTGCGGEGEYIDVTRFMDTAVVWQRFRYRSTSPAAVKKRSMQLLQRLKCVHDELTHERLRNDLSAKVVSKDHCDMVNCRSGYIIEDLPIDQFWNGFEDLSGKQLYTTRHSNLE